MAFPQPTDFDPVGIPDSYIYNNPNNLKKYIWNGSSWSVYYPPSSHNSQKEYASSTPSDVEPPVSIDGDFWYNTTNQNLQVRYNEEWVDAAMNQEQSQILDNLQSSMEVPLFIEGESDYFGELTISDNYFVRRSYQDNTYWPTQANGNYDKNETSCRKLKFQFQDSYFNGYSNLPDLAKLINSANQYKEKGLVNIKFSYERSGRAGHNYSPAVTHIEYRPNERQLELHFSGSTYVGKESDFQNLQKLRLKIEPKNLPNAQTILRHESRFLTVIDPAEITYRKAYDQNHQGSLLYLRLDAANRVVARGSGDSMAYFIPEDILKHNLYYYDDTKKRIIQRRFRKPKSSILYHSSE